MKANDKLIKVKSVNALFPFGFTKVPLPLTPELQEQFSRPIIELVLEDDRTLRLMGIPSDIAVEIWLITNNKQYKSKKDDRLSISELICEIGEIKKVIISDIIPEIGVYVAELDIKVHNNGNTSKFRMIPSHAILLALKSGAEIYVSEKLLNLEYEETETEAEEKSFDEITYW